MTIRGSAVGAILIAGAPALARAMRYFEDHLRLATEGSGAPAPAAVSELKLVMASIASGRC